MTCPHCGGPVLASQRFCGACGKAVPTVNDVTVATLTPPPVDPSATDVTGKGSPPPPPSTPPAPVDPSSAETILRPPEETVTVDGRGPAAGARRGVPTTTLEPGMRFGR